MWEVLLKWKIFQGDFTKSTILQIKLKLDKHTSVVNFGKLGFARKFPEICYRHIG